MTVPSSDSRIRDTSHKIQVADLSLVFREVYIDDLTPTGAQVAAAAGFRSAEGVTVLHLLSSGDLEDIRPTEVADILGQEGRFIVVESDRSYRFTIDGQRFDWPCRVISGGVLRKLGNVTANKELYFELRGERDRLVGSKDLLDLGAAGVESFVSHQRHWKLNVQGVALELHTPTILVRDALVKAGFDPDQGWQIFLKIADAPKERVELVSEIDLTRPGIEKLRLTPQEVNNGKSPEATPLHRAFALLDADDAYLDRLGLAWETLIECDRRWLLIHEYALPAGYTVERTKLALEIPPAYPSAQIYGFYVYPPLALVTGRTIESTQMRGVLLGVEFHGWSRNRGPAAPWNPAVDNVASQLALTDAAIAKEVGG